MERVRHFLCIGVVVLGVAFGASLPAQAQSPFGDEEFEKCVEILGIQVLFPIAGGGNVAENVSKLRAAVEARAAWIEGALENIRADYRLASDMGDLGVHAATYMEAAIEEFPLLDAELKRLKREIPCWQHLERLLKLAKLKKPPPGRTTILPGDPPAPFDPDPYGIREIFDLAKTYFDRRAEELDKIEKTANRNKRNIIAELENRGETERLTELVRLLDEDTISEPLSEPQLVTRTGGPAQIYIGMGVGGFFPGDTDLVPFNQYVPGETGYTISVEPGVRFENVFGQVDVDVGLLLEYSRSPLKTVANVGGGRGPITGQVEQFGIQPTVRLTSAINDYLDISFEIGGGVRRERFKIDGAATLTGWPGTWHVGGSLMMKPPQLPNVRIGPSISFAQTFGLDGATLRGRFFRTSTRSEIRAQVHLILLRRVVILREDQ